jgi:peptidoglycan/LPS O-acetylase OafA/YrhL
MTGPRDWDKELADIDRAIERMPAPPPERIGPGGVAPPGPAPRPALAPATPREVATTWLRVLLAAVLAAALPFWPYPNGCGPGLVLYLAAAAMVVLAGMWAATVSWRRRRPWAHVIALLVVLWGLGLVATQVLPRVGYARHVARWTCG